MEIHLHSEQVNGVGFVHHHAQTANFEGVIIVLRLVEPQYIRESRAAAALHAEAQAVVGRDVFLFADKIELFYGAFCEADGAKVAVFSSIISMKRVSF